VIHACEHFRDVLSVVEGQVAVGMRPYIVTPQGAGKAELYLSGKESGQPPSLSLVRSWQDVRNWRKSLLDCAPESSADLVHAHSFAAGMAAVRGCDCVVYDLRDCIDELALSMGQCEPASWLGRSFRAAEQFILSRAAAVIVHSLGMKEAAEERGATATNIYLIPDPLPPEDEVTASSAQSLTFDFGPQTTVFFFPQLTAARNEKLPPAAMFVLEAFALAIRELPFSRLILEAVVGTRNALREQAAQMGIDNQVSFVNWDEAPAAWQSAHVVIALGGRDGEAASRRRPNPICLKALRHGTALLAADLPSNREVSAEGRGCLWFDPTNSRDLSGRMAFFGSNPGFRRALAAAGRAHLLETRSHVALGRQYSHAYRHALSRKKSKPTGSGLTAFFPAANCA
jgi:glycosyltransferase involved in cell wall biosynthesis